MRLFVLECGVRLLVLEYCVRLFVLKYVVSIFVLDYAGRFLFSSMAAGVFVLEWRVLF